MIDTDKMRALVRKLRGPLKRFSNWAAAYSECADAIDLLLAEVETLKRERDQAKRELEFSKLQTMGATSQVERLTRLVKTLREELGEEL